MNVVEGRESAAHLGVVGENLIVVFDPGMGLKFLVVAVGHSETQVALVSPPGEENLGRKGLDEASVGFGEVAAGNIHRPSDLGRRVARGPRLAT